VEYAILADKISEAGSGMTTRGYKNLKDNMTNLEILLNCQKLSHHESPLYRF